MCAIQDQNENIDYQIYSTIIDSLFVNYNYFTKPSIPGFPTHPPVKVRHFIMVGDSTYYNDEFSELELYLDNIVNYLPEKEKDNLLRNYLNANKQGKQIDINRINAPLKVSPISFKDRFRFFGKKDGEVELKGNIYFFSKIGYTSDNKYAILSYVYFCGGLCGWPAFCYLNNTTSLYTNQHVNA